MADKVKDENGVPIHEGDTVKTKIRGGKHQGVVDQIVTTDEEAEEEGADVKNPPKVLYYDQHGHRVAHNPETLSKLKEQP